LSIHVSGFNQVAEATKPKSDNSKISEMTKHCTGVQMGTNSLEMKHENGVKSSKECGN